MNIICLLSVKPKRKTYDFFKSIQLNTPYVVYIVIDDNDYHIPEYDGIVKIIKFDNNICENAGFKSTHSQFNNKATAREKALYYFTQECVDYKFIWFVEEDVFIPNIYTIENIDKKYGYANDLLVQSNFSKDESKDWWWWKLISTQIKIGPPYAHSMICAIRCSKPMLNVIKDYAEIHNNLFMCEALFNTLALHNKLTILCIEELAGILWRYNWKYTEIVDTNLYHPIKDIDQQYSYRQKTYLPKVKGYYFMVHNLKKT